MLTRQDYIIVSRALRENEAKSFIEHFKDLFEGRMVFTGMYDDNGQGKRYPKYWVVRNP